MTDANELRNLLSGYTGTEKYYRHPLARDVFATDGSKAMFDNAGNGAYWLFDILATEPTVRARVIERGTIFAMLSVDGECEAKLIVADDFDGNTPIGDPIYSRDIEFTDFPEGQWQLFIGLTALAQGQHDIVVYLPSEH